MEKILNLSTIMEIFDGEVEAIQEILVMLDETIPDFIANIRQCIVDKNLETLKFTIHKFKSSCQLVTEPSFVELIRSIEKSEELEINVLLPQIDELIVYVGQLQQEIRMNKLAA